MAPKPDRRIEYLPLSEIKPAPRNPKQHDAEGIARSIGHYGLAELPLLDERTGTLVAGHGRIDDLTTRRDAGQEPPDGVTVDRASGEWLVPIVRGWRSRSDAAAEAYLVASNNLTTKGGWDDDGLAELLGGLNEVDPALLELTGFSEGDLEELLADLDNVTELPPVLPPPDRAPEPPKDAVTRPGDVWLLGPHRIICGDCRDYETVAKLLDGQRVNVAFTSPPYASQRAYDESSGFKPIPPDEYVDWFEDVQANVRAVLADDGSWFVNIKASVEHGQRHLYVHDLLLAHVRQWSWRFVDELCWVDSGDGFPGGYVGRFKDAWEPVFHLTLAGDVKFNPLANGHASKHAFAYDPEIKMSMGDNGYGTVPPRAEGEGVSRPSNVISLPAGGERGVAHSAAFPLALPAWFIRAYSDPGDVVFDPFMGSGTTLMAASQEGRIGYGSEISPAYCDVICRRYQEHTGTVPVLESTGEPVDFTTGGHDD